MGNNAIWTGGVPGRDTSAAFGMFGQNTSDVSLAPAQFHHPVAESVMVDAGSFVFEPGMWAIAQGGDGVKPGPGALTVRGTPRTDNLAVLLSAVPGKTRMLVSGHAARVTGAGTTLVDGTSGMSVGNGAQMPPGGGSESVDPNAPFPGAYFGTDGGTDLGYTPPPSAR